MYYINEYRICINKVRNKLQYFHKPGVSIIMTTNKTKYLDNVYNNFMRINYAIKELIIVLNNNKIDKEYCNNKFKDFNNVRIFQIDENVTLGECLNFCVKQAKYDYIAKMDDDDYYGANYLLDSMNIFEYTDAQVIGKAAHFVYFEEFNILALNAPSIENKYTTSWLQGGTILLKKSVFNEVKFGNVNLGEDTYLYERCNEKGIKMFAGDRYNFVYMKHKDMQDHTWKISSKELLSECKIISNTSDFESYVVI
ncbi:MAG: glycosyltransferase family A protein [Clostridium sp.]|uniref:glycosyltransferase n=1 Tax=Clostridium sp. TaxID=1506 RepID=UPI0039E9EEDF